MVLSHRRQAAEDHFHPAPLWQRCNPRAHAEDLRRRRIWHTIGCDLCQGSGMDRYDALIVGGGPAGSTCARALRLAGWKVCVLDRARFPRDKVCGGWVTPEVFEVLELEPSEYRSAGLTLQEITGF